ncbi:LacI family DNA-binding transcriptional regulator [Nocardia suismassiliense]|uniref:LacI family DNA-binding transcriptional regulator n=1 Tax=Nocardia suismassiliense TaxID=2077092 RepID=A0ABW6QVK0_9NOCA
MARTQPELARLAGVSLSTVTRWMKDPNSVREASRVKLERANSKKSAPGHTEIAKYDRAWSESKILTPRQAFLIVGTIDLWQDYLDAMADSDEIDEISPFDSIDARVLFPASGNRLWLRHAGKEMRHHITMLTRGIHPVEHHHSFFDEVLFTTAISYAPSTEEQYLEAEIEMPGEIPLGDEEDFEDDQGVNAPWDDWGSLMERILLGWSPVADELSAILPFHVVDPHVEPSTIGEVSVPHPFEWFNNTIEGWGGFVEDDIESHLRS